jgi:hypothetical protein
MVRMARHPHSIPMTIGHLEAALNGAAAGVALFRCARVSP